LYGGALQGETAAGVAFQNPLNFNGGTQPFVLGGNGVTLTLQTPLNAGLALNGTGSITVANGTINFNANSRVSNNYSGLTTVNNGATLGLNGGVNGSTTFSTVTGALV